MNQFGAVDIAEQGFDVLCAVGQNGIFSFRTYAIT